jgi:hypothetical protein
MYAYFHDDVVRKLTTLELRRRLAVARQAELAGAVATPPPPDPRDGLHLQLRAALASLGRLGKRPTPSSQATRS